MLRMLSAHVSYESEAEVSVFQGSSVKLLQDIFPERKEASGGGFTKRRKHGRLPKDSDHH